MRMLAAVLTLVLGATQTAYARECPLEERTLQLTPKLLDRIGYEPSSKITSYLDPQYFRVIFNEQLGKMATRTENREVARDNLVPLSVEFAARIESPNVRFLNDLRETVRQPEGRDEIGLYGGNVTYVDPDNIEMHVQMNYDHWKNIIGNNTRITAIKHLYWDLVITREKDNRYVGIDVTMRTGAREVRSKHADALGLILDIAFLSVTVFGKDPSAYIDDVLRKRADREMTPLLEEHQTRANSDFDVESADEEIGRNIYLFGNIFSDKLRHTKETGFVRKDGGRTTIRFFDQGELFEFENSPSFDGEYTVPLPPQIWLVLKKTSISDDPTTMVTRDTACLLEQLFVRLQG